MQNSSNCASFGAMKVDGRTWEDGTWEGAARWQLRDSAQWPLRKKLLWLEEAQILAGQLARGREKRLAEEQNAAR